MAAASPGMLLPRSSSGKSQKGPADSVRCAVVLRLGLVLAGRDAAAAARFASAFASRTFSSGGGLSCFCTAGEGSCMRDHRGGLHVQAAATGGLGPATVFPPPPTPPHTHTHTLAFVHP